MIHPRWLQRLRAGEFVRTLPAIAIYLAYICMDIVSLRALVTERLTVCRCADFGLVVAVAARIATLMTFGLLVVLFIIRRPAVSRDGRILPNLIGLAGFGLPCVFMLLARAPAEAGFNIASSVIVFAGNAGVVLTLSHLGRSLSILPQARRLVTSGPYALVRHPLYFFEIVTFLGIFLQFRSIEAALLVAAICCVQIARTQFEEKVLSNAFSDYAEYRRTVPLLLPRGGRGIGAALHQSAAHLIATILLFVALFGAAFTILPGPGWRVVQVIVNQDAPTVTAVTKAYATDEECQGVASTLADNAHRACPQCSVNARCVKRLDADQEAAIAGHPVSGLMVSMPGVTYLLAAGAAGQATCYALADQLRAAGNLNARCDEAPAAR